MFGEVVYDPSNESKKFYVIGVRQVDSSDGVKSNDDAIGYFYSENDVHGRPERASPNWINIYSCPTFKSNSMNSEYRIRDVFIDDSEIAPSSYHTVFLIYDKTGLLQAELLINKAPSGDHFQELKEILQERSIKDEINESESSLPKEISLVYVTLYLSYSIQFLCTITGKLLPIFKYSTLGLHMYSWLENANWTLNTIVEKKRITLKSGNYILAVMLDVLLGNLLLRFLLENIGHVLSSQILLNNAEVIYKRFPFD